MNRIEWQQNYELGIPQIDVEHRQLLATINELIDAFEKKPKDKKTLSRIIDNLANKTETHFKNEDELMQNLGCAEAKEHQQIHVGLLKELRSWKQSIDNGMIRLDEKFLTNLCKWLTDHLLEDVEDIGECPKDSIAIQTGSAV